MSSPLSPMPALGGAATNILEANKPDAVAPRWLPETMGRQGTLQREWRSVARCLMALAARRNASAHTTSTTMEPTLRGLPLIRGCNDH